MKKHDKILSLRWSKMYETIYNKYLESLLRRRCEHKLMDNLWRPTNFLDINWSRNPVGGMLDE
jgi:hypothetical protein